jgi:formylmethanofuran dehydrogenase subunit C
MSLTLIQALGSPLPVDLEGITPDRLQRQSRDEIERIEVFHGNRRVPLAEVFQLSGDGSDGRLVFEGALGGVHRIGAGMNAGHVIVQGDAGRHVGAEMTGGRIDVSGDAGDWVGAEMKGGAIHIGGSAGHWVGSAYPGSRRGMTDGSILIEDTAGDGVGRSMRRGLVAIGGSCGAHAGFGMIAGTILVFGTCGPHPGAEMRRGTIGLFGPHPPRLLPTFRRAGRFRPLFFHLIEHELRRLGFRLPGGLCEDSLALYHGDLLSLGKGEVWVRDDGSTP